MMRLLLPVLFSILSLALFSQPDNDLCETATPLIVGMDICSATEGDNTDATDSGTDPTPTCADYQGEDIWFSFIAPMAGEVTLETSDTGGMTDTGMAIYSGDCDGLEQLTCDDDGGEGFFSLIELEGLVPDETYFVRLWAYGAASSGAFEICAWAPPFFPPPLNDDCDQALEVAVGGPLICEPTIVSNSGATASDTLLFLAPSCANYNGSDVWLEVVVPLSGEIIFETSEDTSFIDTGMAVYSGQCGDLVEIECDDDDGEGFYSMIELIDATPGDTLYVRIWEYGGGFENSFSFCAYEPSLCSDIGALYVDSMAQDYLQLGWGSENGGAEFTVEYGPGGFTPGTGMLISGTVGIDGPPVGIGGLDEGTAYDVYVTEICAENMPSNTIGGTFFTAFPPSENDFCDEAIVIEVGGAEDCQPMVFSNGGATDSGTLPAPGCADYQGGDIWFQLTMPVTGAVIVETFADLGLNDIGMAAYSGDCDGLTLLDCDDDDGVGLFSYLELTGVTPGETIYIRIWEYGGNAEGTFQLCAYQPPLCSPIEALENLWISEDSLSFTWTSLNYGATYFLEYGQQGFEIGDGTTLMGATGIDGPPVGIGGLEPSTTYDFFLYEICVDEMPTDTLTATVSTAGPPPTNDDLCDATMLIVDAPEVSMNSTGATSETDEPVGNCWFLASAEVNSVWASFVAPSSGGAIVSTDYLDNEMNDTHITIYSTDADCSDMLALTEVGCDEDGGILGIPSYASIATMTDLTAGDTYYVQIDGFDETMGQFFISVSSPPLSISELDRLALRIFPNPTEDVISVDCSKFRNRVTVLLTDINGKTVRTWPDISTAAGTLSFDLSEMESGLYVLHIIGEEAQAIERVVVE